MDRLAAGRTTLEELIRVMPYSSVYQFRQLVGTGRVGVSAAETPGGRRRSCRSGHLGGSIRVPIAGTRAVGGTGRRPAPGSRWRGRRRRGARPGSGRRPRRPEVANDDRMIGAFRDLGRARSLTEVLTVLADHAALETGRVAILTVANSRLRIWTQRGWDGADSTAIDEPIVPDTVFDIAVRRGHSVSTSEAPVGRDGDPLSDLLAARVQRNQGSRSQSPSAAARSRFSMPIRPASGSRAGRRSWRERLDDPGAPRGLASRRAGESWHLPPAITPPSLRITAKTGLSCPWPVVLPQAASPARTSASCRWCRYRLPVGAGPSSKM